MKIRITEKVKLGLALALSYIGILLIAVFVGDRLRLRPTGAEHTLLIALGAMHVGYACLAYSYVKMYRDEQRSVSSDC